MRGGAQNQSFIWRMVSKEVDDQSSATHPRKRALWRIYQERTMEQTQTTTAAVTSGLGRLLRFVAFILTLGFAYPHVCTERLKLE